jgi:hypothetical protein
MWSQIAKLLLKCTAQMWSINLSCWALKLSIYKKQFVSHTNSNLSHWYWWSCRMCRYLIRELSTMMNILEHLSHQHNPKTCLMGITIRTFYRSLGGNIPFHKLTRKWMMLSSRSQCWLMQIVDKMLDLLEGHCSKVIQILEYINQRMYKPYNTGLTQIWNRSFGDTMLGTSFHIY